jgi:hypothetical protein
MPCTVTAFGVRVASPGDAAMEVIIAREVIREWNALHAFEQKRVLLPLDNDDKGGCDVYPNDMLIAFFCGSSGAPIDLSSDAEAEIERQLKGGRPAHVYFSGARVDLIGTDAERAKALEGFKKKYAPATVDLYGDEKEFRAKFARNLDATINTHPHFKVDEASQSSTAAESSSSGSRSAEASLSTCAQTILVEACDDFEAYIGRIKIGNMLKIQANGKQLVEQDNPEAAAKWDSAFHELLSGGYIRDAGCNGQLFQISTKGFEFLKTIGKTPVGYIAELGGM